MAPLPFKQSPGGVRADDCAPEAVAALLSGQPDNGPCAPGGPCAKALRLPQARPVSSVGPAEPFVNGISL